MQCNVMPCHILYKYIGHRVVVPAYLKAALVSFLIEQNSSHLLRWCLSSASYVRGVYIFRLAFLLLHRFRSMDITCINLIGFKVRSTISLIFEDIRRRIGARPPGYGEERMENPLRHSFKMCPR